MKSTNAVIFTLFFSVVILAGCTVRNNKQEPQDLKTEKKTDIAWLLAGDVSKAWAIESFTVDGIDQLQGLAACELDNLDVYYRNLVYESIEGKLRCKTSDPEVRRHGKWSLNADSTAIDVKLGMDLFTLQIVEITEKKLHYRSNDNNRVTEAVLVASDYQSETIIQADTIH
jgi:hypothetical protein